jgi:hypothetical protein
METQAKKRVLVVANRTAATARLLDEVSRRRASGSCEFALLIPDVTDRKKADWTLETALPLLRKAARGPVEGLIGGADPFASVENAVRDGNFDEIIISTLPKKSSKWLRRDLVRRTKSLGLPTTVVTPGMVRDTVGTMLAIEPVAYAGQRTSSDRASEDDRPRGR